MHQGKIKNKKFLDISGNDKQQGIADFRGALKNSKSKPILFSKGKIIDSFFTEDSKLYITPNEQAQLRKGMVLDRKNKKWDSLSSRVVCEFVRYQPSEKSLLLEALQRRYDMLNDTTAEATKSFVGQFSTVRLWNASIIGSILFGMVTMTFVYRYLGQGASAKQIDVSNIAISQQIPEKGRVLGAADTNGDAQSFAEEVRQIDQAKSKLSLEKEIAEMVKGYPIEEMVPYIAKQDRTVAAFIVAIAKKESSWGQHVPVLNGQDCYNYWGYRGQRKLMGTGGHTCFNSPQDAVETIAKRITTLVEENGKDTPEKMVLWKCGSSCAATGGRAAANKWVSDVDYVFKKFDMKD
jgi:hypothetical protein